MPKLRIRIFGVCLATPLTDQTAPQTVKQLTVLTPMSPRSKLASDGKTQIDALYTYFIVNSDNVSPDSPRKADHILNNRRFSVFMLHREEVKLSVDNGSGVNLPYGEAGFPDGPNLQSKDPRWICNLPGLVPGATIRQDCLTLIGSAAIPEIVCARLAATSGEFTGEFPCGPKEEKTKMHRIDLERHFAQEMVLTVDLPDGLVSLQCQPFDTNQQTNRIDLRALGQNDIQIFLVNAPLVTMEDLGTVDPCHVPNDHHHESDIDYEFEVLWELIAFPEGSNPAEPPVPRLVQVEGTRVDCVPGGG